METSMDFESLCVLGLGYIGLPTASTFATHGIHVFGVDINQKIIESLREGEPHIHEPGLRTLVKAAFGSGNLQIEDRPREADAFILAVPTPFLEDKRADLSAVRAAAESILPVLRKGNLVVLESTSPPRTTLDLVAPILEQSGLIAGEDFYMAYSAERVLPGQILRELIENARVIGGINPISAEKARDLYSIFVRGEIVLTDATTAEMVKLMENTYRDVNIAIANEFSRLAARLGVDVWEAIQYANRHPRVNILKPGPGVGGHCIGVDPWFLVEAARDITPLIYTARKVNDGQPHFVVELVEYVLGGVLAGKKVAALGLSYKANVDDLRESPAISVVQLLSQAGAEVAAYEPYKPDAQIPGVKVVPNLSDALVDAELILLLVGHGKLIELKPSHLIELSPARLIVDASEVSGWEKSDFQTAGFGFFRLGDGKTARQEKSIQA
jgi:UDP-N-acetyl-D-mannosaminuronic acid dehydrogenase